MKCCYSVWYQFLQVGEGDGGAVEELGHQPAFLIATVADGSTCKTFLFIAS